MKKVHSIGNDLSVQPFELSDASLAQIRGSGVRFKPGSSDPIGPVIEPGGPGSEIGPGVDPGNEIGPGADPGGP